MQLRVGDPRRLAILGVEGHVPHDEFAPVLLDVGDTLEGGHGAVVELPARLDADPQQDLLFAAVVVVEAARLDANLAGDVVIVVAW